MTPGPAGRLTADAVRRRMTEAAVGRAVRGDHQLSGLSRPEAPLRRAAVLVPLVQHPDGLTVLLTQRSAHLTDHAGQISFPGGRIEDTDPDPERAALREAWEEVGLDPARVELVGRLDRWETTTGFEIVPVVGLVHPPLDLKPDPFEVAEAFEVPLDFLVDPGNCERRSREVRGAQRWFYVLPYQGRNIWGATAGMLVNLAQVLTADG